MRIIVLAGLIIITLVRQGDVVVAAGQTSAVAAELTQIEHRLVKAWLDGDRKTVDSILASEWSVIDLTGHVLTKEQVMKEFGSGDRRIESGSVDDLNIRVYGDTAVVTSRSVLAGTYKGKRLVRLNGLPTSSSSGMGAGKQSPRKALRSRNNQTPMNGGLVKTVAEGRLIVAIFQR